VAVVMVVVVVVMSDRSINRQSIDNLRKQM
jgi:hypothetical protein